MAKLQEVILHEGREYVLASSSLADDRVRILKAGDEFAVLDRQGDILRLEGTHQGLYWADTRHLSEFVLRLGSGSASRPLLLSSRVTRDNTLLTVDLTNSSFKGDDGATLRQDTLHIERAKLLWDAVGYETIVITNFGDQRARVHLFLEFSADFADIFEVRGQHRPRRGKMLEPQTDGDSVVLAYVGLDEVRRETELNFSPRPTTLQGDRAVFDLDIAPKESTQIDVAVRCCCDDDTKPRTISFPEVLSLASDAAEEARLQECEITTSNEQFNDWLERSRADLNMLTTKTEHGFFPYAGTPWFSTPFGRDSLITALQTLFFNPSLARGVLGYLAAYQAEEEDPVRDAEPGKILHESRKSEMAALKEVPFERYYGSVDSTPLFVVLAGAYDEATGDLEFLKTIWPNVRRALDWIDEYGDLDGDGFVEYARKNERGIRNQAWKDSDDSVFHADGRLAEGAIAMVEVQGYVYEAWRQASKLARRLGDSETATRLKKRAQEMRSRFHDAFWCDSIGTYAIALDGEKEPCCVRSSNPGHCLFTGIVPERAAGRVAQALLEDDIFSGWGVRTISDREKRYNPMSYHNGTVWPHDNSLAAAGLARYGLKASTSRIMTSLYRASIFFDLHRLPELFCGFSRNVGDGPTLYPVACAPQAWAAGSPFLLLQACLGMQIKATRNQVHFHHPVLPDYLEEVVMKRLRVGPHALDVRLHRYPDTVGLDVIRRDGPVSVHMVT